MLRVTTYWGYMACERHFDYYFTSTIPQRMNFHLPGYVQEDDTLTDRECKVYVTFYTAKPYRIDVQMNGLFMLPNNARWMGDQIEWERPRRDKHLPTLQVLKIKHVSIHQIAFLFILKCK